VLEEDGIVSAEVDKTMDGSRTAALVSKTLNILKEMMGLAVIVKKKQRGIRSLQLRAH
jgi:hypothetical protein